MRRATPDDDLHDFGGARIPRYRRIRQLAAGVVAQLYLAEREMSGARVVLKVARDREPGGLLDHPFRRFLQEFEIAQRVHDAGVVQVYDLGVSDAHAWLVMEYFPAGDLRARVRSGVTVREALRLGLRCAQALGAIHRAGILHRDLKPGNIMLRADGSCALIDFGLARDAALAMEVSDQGLILGTPHYMSPEQGHGEPIDARSDLYSLGVILFEMLARRKPYLADNPMAIVYLHRKAPIPRLPDELAALQPLIERFLAKAPCERLPDAAAAAEALQQALRQLPEGGEHP